MTAVLIEAADLKQLALELNAAHGTAPQGPYAWAEPEGISSDAIDAVLEAGLQMFSRNHAADVPVAALLHALISGSFHLGWEAHKEYAGGAS